MSQVTNECVSENLGDYVLVHIGFAISKIDEAEAHKTLEALQELANLQDELGPEEEPVEPRA